MESSKTSDLLLIRKRRKNKATLWTLAYSKEQHLRVKELSNQIMLSHMDRNTESL